MFPLLGQHQQFNYYQVELAISERFYLYVTSSSPIGYRARNEADGIRLQLLLLQAQNEARNGGVQGSFAVPSPDDGKESATNFG